MIKSIMISKETLINIKERAVVTIAPPSDKQVARARRIKQDGATEKDIEDKKIEKISIASRKLRGITEPYSQSRTLSDIQDTIKKYVDETSRIGALPVEVVEQELIKDSEVIIARSKIKPFFELPFPIRRKR